MARRKWNKQRVIEAIRQRHRLGLPLANVRKHDPGLESAGRDRFGTWPSAVLAAGLTPKPRRSWGKAAVIAWIQEWHRKGVPPETIWLHDKNLHVAAQGQFDSWRAAVVAAGFRPVNRQWSKELVIKELQDRFPDGIPRSFRWKDNNTLICSARKYFGNWHDALVAAGLRQGKRKIPRPWTQQRVIEAIRSRHEQGLSLSAVWREDKTLYRMGTSRFGTWRLAMKAAGFPLPPKRKWTPEGIIREIRCRRKQGTTLDHSKREDRLLYSAARRHFGGWPDALRAAGMETEPYRSWSRQSVIKALRNWRARGLPLSRVWIEDRQLFVAASRAFGSWDDTREALGLPPKQARNLSKHHVIAELQEWYGKPGGEHRVVRRTLAAAAIRLFGSLDNAMDAAGVEPKSRIWWTHRRVIQTIQDRYVHGQPIHLVGFRDKNLAAAAQRRFGGWAEALAAAGLAEKYREPAPKRRWTAEAVIEAILARRRRGLPLTNVGRRDAGLYIAARKHFGSWRQALTAAGVGPGDEVK